MTLEEDFICAEQELVRRRIMDEHYLRKRNSGMNLNVNHLLNKCFSTRNYTRRHYKGKKKVCKKITKMKPKLLKLKNTKKRKELASYQNMKKNPQKHILKRSKNALKKYGLRQKINLIHPVKEEPANWISFRSGRVDLQIFGAKPYISQTMTKKKHLFSIKKIKELKVWGSKVTEQMDQATQTNVINGNNGIKFTEESDLMENKEFCRRNVDTYLERTEYLEDVSRILFVIFLF